MPEAQQRRVTDVGCVVATPATGTSRSVPLRRNLLVQQLAVHVHLTSVQGSLGYDRAHTQETECDIMRTMACAHIIGL